MRFVAQAELKERLAKVYEVKDPNCIFVFKFRTHFVFNCELRRHGALPPR